MSLISGYTGIYRQPYPNNATYGDSIFMITDEKHQELDLFLLTPGCYKDAYMIASSPTYQIINIFPPAMDGLFISDVFRLVTDLLKIKKAVKWYYPDKVDFVPTNVLFQVNQMRGNYFSSPNITDLAIEFKRSNTLDDDHRFYDIYLCMDDIYAGFIMYMDAAKLTSIMTASTEDAVDFVHMPYNTTFYGGLSAIECGKLNKAWMPKIVPNNFRCREEFIMCRDTDFSLPKRIIL